MLRISGKTTWLLYATIRLIQKGNEPFMLYFNSMLLLFYNSIVFEMVPFSSGVTVPRCKGHRMFMLIDTDQQKGPPPDICTRSDGSVFPVHAASPNPIRYSSWMNQRPLAVMIGMPLWSYEELISACVILFKLYCNFADDWPGSLFKTRITTSGKTLDRICLERTTNFKRSSGRC